MNKAAIMVVDGHVSLDKTMSHVMKRQGYDVIVNIDGRAVISKANENPVDLCKESI